jgi:hypothetical protein
MAYTGTQLLNFYLKNLEGTFSGDELQSLIDTEGSVKLGQAAALEIEAEKVAFTFKAGDVSSDKGAYYRLLTNMAKQIRTDAMAYPSDVSEMISWSGSAEYGTAEVQTWVDTEYGAPDF